MVENFANWFSKICGSDYGFLYELGGPSEEKKVTSGSKILGNSGSIIIRQMIFFKIDPLSNEIFNHALSPISMHRKKVYSWFFYYFLFFELLLHVSTFVSLFLSLSFFSLSTHLDCYLVAKHLYVVPVVPSTMAGHCIVKSASIALQSRAPGQSFFDTSHQ